MSSPRWMVTLALLAVLGAGLPARAELNACDVHPCICHMYQTGDTPDPFPWGVLLGNGLGDPINPMGDQRGDLWPDFGVNPVSGQAEVVWAYNDGSDYEIAFAETSNGHWGQIGLLTNNTSRDVDARLAFSHTTGSTKVVFWTQDSLPRVKLVERAAPAAGWGPAEVVSDGLSPARMPSTAVAQGLVFIGYEQDSAQGGKDILLATRPDAGTGQSFAHSVLGHTTWNGSAHVTVDVAGAGEVVFAAWVQSETQIGFSIWTGINWEPPRFIPYSGNALSLDDVRIVVRRQVLTLHR